MTRRNPEQLLGVRAVATALDLTVEQIQTAVHAGLLEEAAKGRITSASVDAAAADRATFAAALTAARPVNLKEAASLLRTKPDTVMRAIADSGIDACTDVPWAKAGTAYWRTSDILGPVAARLRPGRAARPGRQSDTRPDARPRTSPGRPSDTRARRGGPGLQASKAALSEASAGQQLRVRVVSGLTGPSTLTIHEGPTNSGKTHDALAALAAAGRGVYAGPLRMLAREAHTKLSALVGAEHVGLITGEEQENPDAAIICATTEAAPLRHGGVLVLDECHWLSDPQRGWAWTRALVASTFEHVHAITDPAAADLIAALVPDADQVTRVAHPRLAALEYAGAVALADVPDGSAVVVFSRAAVLSVADMLARAGRRPAVLYGALPPAARAAQVDLLASGAADVIVTTDVIGHGINLPLTAVALAETQKFDGTERRDLLLWEAAQILGRAGRYGHGTEVGQTLAVTGPPWFTSDPALVTAGTEAAAGRTATGWPHPGRVGLRPTLGELGARTARDLPVAVEAFATTTRQAADLLPVTPFDATGAQQRLAAILALPGAAHLPVQTVWGLTTCPVDDVALLAEAAGGLLGLPGAAARLSGRARDAQVAGTSSLASAERAAGVARNLRVLTLAAGDLPGVTAADAARWEELAGQAVCAALRAPGATDGFGRCGTCGRDCAPWLSRCVRCAALANKTRGPRPGPRRRGQHRRR